MKTYGDVHECRYNRLTLAPWRTQNGRNCSIVVISQKEKIILNTYATDNGITGRKMISNHIATLLLYCQRTVGSRGLGCMLEPGTT